MTNDAAEPQRAAAPLTYKPHNPSFLSNPYVIAGTAVAGAIVLAVMVVIFLGSSGGGGSGETDRRSNTPVVSGGGIVTTQTARPRSGLIVTAIAASNVHSGPDFDYGELGALRSGQDFTVVGRNPNSTWYQIQFPPGTSFTGWVPATALRVPEASESSIPITETTPIPRPAIPTSPPVIIPTRAPTREPVSTPTLGPATPTTPTTGGSDLSAQAVVGTCAVGNRLRVSVTNNGPAALAGVPVAVLTQNAQGVQKSIVSEVVTLAVGQTVTLDTGYIVEERVVSVVDPLGTTGDPNAGNNRVDCVVGPVATATPRIATATPAVLPTIAPTANLPVPTLTPAAPPPATPTTLPLAPTTIVP